MSQAPPATAGPAAASAAKGSAAAPSSEGGAPQDPAAAERSGSTEAAEEAVAVGKGGSEMESDTDGLAVELEAHLDGGESSEGDGHRQARLRGKP
jgi:hypothetical protein